MIWFVLAVILACILLLAVPAFFRDREKVGIAIFIGCFLGGIFILSCCFQYMYARGCKKQGYLMPLSKLQKDQKYEFFGQILTRKGYVVILEDDDLEIRCVLSRDQIPAGTEYLKKDLITESVPVKVRRTILSPVDPEG